MAKGVSKDWPRDSRGRWLTAEGDGPDRVVPSLKESLLACPPTAETATYKALAWIARCYSLAEVRMALSPEFQAGVLDDLEIQQMLYRPTKEHRAALEHIRDCILRDVSSPAWRATMLARAAEMAIALRSPRDLREIVAEVNRQFGPKDQPAHAGPLVAVQVNTDAPGGVSEVLTGGQPAAIGPSKPKRGRRPKRDESSADPKDGGEASG